MDVMEQLKQASTFIEERISMVPRIGIVLGSGLGALGGQVSDSLTIPYDEIPHFCPSTVEGHHGLLVIGRLQNKPVLVMQGRLHFYEGLSMDQVVFPVRCMKLLGVENLIVTNAAGSLHADYRPGTLMLIRDHIKMVTDSPLRGPNLDAFGPRFNDMSDPYTSKIRDLAKQCAARLGIELKEGVYCYMPGPSYETASEVRMLGLLGGHAVGMSTVPEVITAAHCGMKVLGVSCLTNMGTGILEEPLRHDDIIRVGEQVRTTFVALLEAIIDSWPLSRM
ncbi:MAG: purine-nucleoside phosphorylase [Desulfofustis sp.]|nr:purine-nucleoside phosphorylase [Desulfofustis sp.]